MALIDLTRSEAMGHADLRRRWTAAFVVGELIGFIPPALTGAGLVWLDVGDALLVIGLTLAGVLEGAVLGFAQGKVLAGYRPNLDRRHWLLATAAAAGLAWLVGMGGSVLITRGDAVSVGWALAVGPAAVLALLSMGFFQWLVLRRVLPGSSRWILVTTGAWLVGVMIPVVALSIIPNGWPPAAHAVVAVGAAAVMGLVVGSITGRTLGHLVEADQPAVVEPSSSVLPVRVVLAAKFAWTAVSCFVVESAIFGLAALPATVFYQWHLGLDIGMRPLRLFLLAAAFLPAYIIFALLFMGLSAEATRLLGWRPPPSAELRIAELPKELRDWARYAIVSHLVHVVAGVAFRSTPVWVWYMRRNGATIGKHVWINSLQVGDDCLLELGDEVVIGAGVHLSAHTVEGGRLRLAPISLGRGTTVGVGAHVGIGVVTGENTQIGSMSVVPKHSRLKPDTTYVGIPARPLDGPSDRHDHQPSPST